MDQDLGKLLAIIIIYEKHIESLKLKLAGNELFDTRVAYCTIYQYPNNAIHPHDIIGFVSSTLTLEHVTTFTCKYTTDGTITYQEFIKLLLPKTNKLLAQRLLVRTAKKGAQIPYYLIKYLQQLLEYYVKMTIQTEKIKRRIQEINSLTYLEMLYFFKVCLNSHSNILSFINKSTGPSQFTEDDVKYISLHVKSNNPITQFEEEDIKQTIFPLDTNYQQISSSHATYQQPQPYYQNNQNYQSNNNFLGRTYVSKFQIPNQKISKQSKQYQAMPTSKYQYPQKPTSYRNNQSVNDRMPQNLYIDKFSKPVQKIQLDAYLNKKIGENRNKEYGRNSYQKFEDDLQSGSSSAFELY